jgi:hypothetical protein
LSRSPICPATKNSAIVEERTDAHHDQHHVDHLSGERARLRKAADGRRGIERPANPVPQADFLAERECDGAEHQQREDDRHQQADPASERRELLAGRVDGALRGSSAHMRMISNRRRRAQAACTGAIIRT